LSTCPPGWPAVSCGRRLTATRRPRQVPSYTAPKPPVPCAGGAGAPAARCCLKGRPPHGLAAAP
jgi:hypothetical protein